MRIATWNVNSVRSRIDRVEAFLNRHDIDVLALQETKARDDQWPTMGLEALGYDVATLRPQPVERRRDRQPGRPRGRRAAASTACRSTATRSAAEARAIGATCGGVRVWSLYVPNGRAIGDPHLDYKLAWLEALRAAAAGWLADDPERQVALTGDWNIAPRDEDVFDMAQFAKSTHVTPPERAAFQAVVDAGYADVVRPLHPGPEVYTYWDYYRQRFERNRGMRIDFVLGSPALRRPGHRRRDRPRRAGRQGRQRPRAGDRRPGRLSAQARRARCSRTRGVEPHLVRDQPGDAAQHVLLLLDRRAAGRPTASRGGRRTPSAAPRPRGQVVLSRSVNSPDVLDLPGAPADVRRCVPRAEGAVVDRSPIAALTACSSPGRRAGAGCRTSRARRRGRAGRPPASTGSPGRSSATRPRRRPGRSAARRTPRRW